MCLFPSLSGAAAPALDLGAAAPAKPEKDTCPTSLRLEANIPEPSRTVVLESLYKQSTASLEMAAALSVVWYVLRNRKGVDPR